MRHSLIATFGVVFAVSGTLLFLTASPIAQRRRGGDADNSVPTATNTIVDNPQAFYGKVVTVSAGVETVLSKTSFVVDQRKMTGPDSIAAVGKPILVIASYLNAPLDLKRYLLMKGQLAKFDAAAIAKMPNFTLDLSPELCAKYEGQPVLLATSVLSSQYKELARKPLPPPGVEELAMNLAMKIIAPTSAALRTAVTESNVAAINENASKLKPALKQTETAWDDLGVASAAQIARDAQDLVATIEKEAAAGRWDVARLSAGALSQQCTMCHGTYRERQEDGSFRLQFAAF
jgi:hypothetical protein